jgi:hypothetical protein
MKKEQYYVDRIKARFNLDIKEKGFDVDRIERLKKAIDAEDISKKQFDSLSEKEEKEFLEFRRDFQKRVDSESGE